MTNYKLPNVTIVKPFWLNLVAQGSHIGRELLARTHRSTLTEREMAEPFVCFKVCNYTMSLLKSKHMETLMLMLSVNPHYSAGFNMIR